MLGEQKFLSYTYFMPPFEGNRLTQEQNLVTINYRVQQKKVDP